MRKYISEGYVEVFDHAKWCCVEFELPDNHTQDELYKAESTALIDWMDDNSSFDTKIKEIES